MFYIVKLNCIWVTPIPCETLVEAQKRIARKSQDAMGEWYGIATGDEKRVIEVWANGVMWIKGSE